MVLSLQPLPYPVYFVCRVSQESWLRLKAAIDEAASLPADDLVDYLYEALRLWSPEYRSGIGTETLNWPIQTYVQLMKRGLNVELTRSYVPGQICVAVYEQLSPKRLSFNSFVVACQHDRGRPELCNHRIVQNQLNVVDARVDHFVPHWPQPNIIPRDRNRGCQLDTLVYKGRSQHLAAPFRQEEFVTALHGLGIQLETSDENAQDLKQAWKDWHDYSQTDAVLAVRESKPLLLSVKPASKLVNAWLAGCPALLGPEPAYQQLRRSKLDYIEVHSSEEAIAALRRLKEEPGYYQAMVENGWQRVRDYDADGVAKCWREILAGPVVEGYERWRRQSPLGKLIGRPIWYGRQIRRHHWEKAIFKAQAQFK
ncbi:hypothetical protein XM38_025240 [Halomicronema hongdechloris C2206]|uniref:Uncharacterized protein n=1 Tax=Halomicronema hongdechloris C2206 TaxID=1641165 RepID=A0A1Z3HMN7_9CYAN|nr:glycosyltransferase [Halomicronema hongdechloris]ASC71572.1 hypothetical protein XM38_025240 [Halomicronema hongdechloris C2206]